MRALTINETWDYTKRMWMWIAFQKEVLQDERSVADLKRIWLRENEPEFVDVAGGGCFFCEAAGACDDCPGRLVDDDFFCGHPSYGWDEHPGAFYREILRLDEIRTAEPSEHVWKHGDVFTNCIGHMWIYLEPAGTPRVLSLDAPGGDRDCGSDPDIQTTLCNPVFLFNIKDKLSDTDE